MIMRKYLFYILLFALCLGCKSVDPDVEVLINEQHDDVIKLPEYGNVIATMYSYILEEIVIDGVAYFNYSKDLGSNWKLVENTIGDITHAHIFSDGTFLLCGRRKAYTTKDFDSFTESVIYDIDGKVLTELPRDGFYAVGHHDVYNVIDGHELEIWGEYILERENNPCVWYTIDKGATIRCAFKFGVSEIGGKVINCRHVHKVTYCRKDGSIYVTTGDAYSAGEDHVLRGTINVHSLEWDWAQIADGRMFKFGIVYFDDQFMYIITDYTEKALSDKKGILYIPINMVQDINNDIEKFKYVWRLPEDEEKTHTGLSMAPFDILIDGNGNKILFGDSYSYGYIWISRKGYEFKRYRLNNRKMYVGLNIIGPNFNGDVYIQSFGDGVTYTDENLKLNRGRSYNLTKIMRENIDEDFMKVIDTKYNF